MESLLLAIVIAVIIILAGRYLGSPSKTTSKTTTPNKNKVLDGDMMYTLGFIKHIMDKNSTKR